MPQDGIAYNGEFIQGDADSDDESLHIEIPEDDPNFLVRAANKNPPSAWERARAIIGAAGEGAYSWPFDYTLCIHWILGHAGFYGSRVQENCFYHRDRILAVLEAALRVTYYLIFRQLLWRILNNETAQNIALDQLDEEGLQRLKDAIGQLSPEEEGIARTAGRYASGQFFTRWMQTRIRKRGGGNLETKGIAWTNTVMLAWGSAIHASINHPDDFGLIEIFVAWINGDADFVVSIELYKEIFRAAHELSENPAFQDSLGVDYELYREFISELINLGEAGNL